MPNFLLLQFLWIFFILSHFLMITLSLSQSFLILTFSFSFSLSHSLFLTQFLILTFSFSLSHSHFLILTFSLSLSHSLFLTFLFLLFIITFLLTLSLSIKDLPLWGISLMMSKVSCNIPIDKIYIDGPSHRLLRRSIDKVYTDKGVF